MNDVATRARTAITYRGGRQWRRARRFARARRRGMWMALRTSRIGARRAPQVPAARLTVLCVYRRSNAALVETVVRALPAPGRDVRLWALDAPADVLRADTVGSGPGTKFELLNRLYRERPVEAANWVVVLDDDVVFARGDLTRFVDVAARAGFGLAQPAHARCSFRNHEITVRRRGSRARTTTFVEIGPVFAVHPAWREEVLPFPDDAGFGWGLEIAWSALRDRGCRLGVVDAVPIVHTVRAGGAYDSAEEARLLQQRLDDAGLETFTDIQRDLARWPVWHHAPPWSRAPVGAANGARTTVKKGSLA